jgi:transcriptional regulator with XRE-family HTH domain
VLDEMTTTADIYTGTKAGAEAGGEPASWSEFGRQLRRLRVSADFTQERLAALSGVAARSIGSIERGQSAPRAATVDLLVGALARGRVNGDPLRRLARRIRMAELA